MIRVVVQTCEFGAAVHIGGSVEQSVKTFDIEAPELEAHLGEYEDAKRKASELGRPTYWHRTVAGIEIHPAKGKQ